MRIETEFRNGGQFVLVARSFATDNKFLYIIEKINGKADYTWKFNLAEIDKIKILNI